jgi:hypothetical protein
MNEEGILLLSTVMEMLTVFSIGFALIVLWMHARAKRANKLKDDSGSRQSGLSDERRGE